MAVFIADGDFLLLHHESEGLHGQVFEAVGNQPGMDAEAGRFTAVDVALQNVGGGLHHVLVVGCGHCEFVALHLEEEVVEYGDG